MQFKELVIDCMTLVCTWAALKLKPKQSKFLL